uniref:Uncharacterized protein n=1 Tax=Megaselia scalaris TaxID=36166 RepID=T1GME9_MEGSC
MVDKRVVLNCCKDLAVLLKEEEEANKINRAPKLWCREWMQHKEKGHSEKILKELRSEDPKGFTKLLRISPDCFDFILKEIGPCIQKADTNMREALPAKTKLEITLHYLATGEDLTQMEYDFRHSCTWILSTKSISLRAHSKKNVKISKITL